jgi:MYXO-CTERM domain-containing protein
MKTQMMFATAAMSAAIGLTTSAYGAFSFIQTAGPAPTYDTLLTFDEPAGPTGVVPADTWSSLGITIHSGVDVNNAFVIIPSAWDPPAPWIDSNVVEGPFGVNLHFSTPVNALSLQAWETFGGELGIFITNADGSVVIDGASYQGAWGGLGDTWYNITATDGDSISHVVITGLGFFTGNAVVDNISWSNVPGPGSLALLGIAGLASSRRRRPRS